MDAVLARSVMIYSGVSIKVPMLPNAVIPLHELVIRSEMNLTQSQWRQEQTDDYSLKCVIALIEDDKLMTYSVDKTDPADLKCMLRIRKDFFVGKGLLYQKAYFKLSEK